MRQYREVLGPGHEGASRDGGACCAVAHQVCCGGAVPLSCAAGWPPQLESPLHVVGGHQWRHVALVRIPNTATAFVSPATGAPVVAASRKSAYKRRGAAGHDSPAGRSRPPSAGFPLVAPTADVLRRVALEPVEALGGYNAQYLPAN